MSAYGAIQCWFYNSSLQRLYDNNGTLSTSTGNGYILAKSMRFRQQFKRISWGSFRIPPDDVANYPLIQVGHIVVMFTTVHANTRRLGAFTIKEVNIIVQDGTPMLEVSGPGLEDELARVVYPYGVGESAIEAAFIINDHGIGNTVIRTNKDAEFEDGQDISIQPTSAWAYVMGVPITGPIWRGIVDGDPVDGGTYWAVTIDPPLNEVVPQNTCYLVGTDYKTPTTQDVSRVLSEANWTATVEGGGSGTQSGTSLPRTNDTVFSLLNTISDITGEWWRPKIPAIGNAAPTREIAWRRTSDSSGVTLVMPNQADAPSRVGSSSYAIIEGFTREYSDERITGIYAYGGGTGQDAISLSDLPYGTNVGVGWSKETVNELGQTLLTYDATASALYPVERTEVVSFPNISPEGVSEEAKTQAATQLLAAAKEYLLARNEAFRFYNVTCVTVTPFRLGQTVNFDWSDHYLNLDKPNLYIIEINTQVGDDGVVRDGLVLSEVLIPRIKGPAMLVEMVRNAQGLSRGSSSPSVGFRPNPGPGGSQSVVTVASSTPAGALTISGQALSFQAYENAESGSKVMATDAQGGVRVNRVGIGTSIPDTSGHLWVTGDLKFDGEQAIGTLAASKLWVMPGADLELKPAGDVILQPQGGDVNLFAPRMTFNQAATVSSTAGNISLLPAADLILDPVGDDVLVGDTVRLQSNGFSAGFLGNGWRVDGEGNAEFRRVTADEMHITRFTMEQAVAVGRSLWLTPGASKLTRDFTVPAAINGTSLIYVEDVPGAPNVRALGVNSYVMIRYYSHDVDGGHFDLFNVWGQVSGYTNIADSSEQRYTFTLKAISDYDGSDPHTSYPLGKTIPRGEAVMDFGISGSGYISINAGDAGSDDNSPNMRIMTWATNPWTSSNRTLHTLVGKLKAATGLNEFGLFAGDGTANDDPYAVISNVRARINNIPLVLEEGGVSKIALDPSVPSIGVGDSLPTGPDTGGDGFWVGKFVSNDYRLRIGGTSTSGNPRMVYDGSSLQFRNGNTNDPLISFDDDGSSYFAGEMSIGADGSIVAGNTTLNADGLQIQSSDFGTGSNGDQRIRFMHGTAQVGSIEGFGNAYKGIYLYGGPTLGTSYGMITISDIDGVVINGDPDVTINAENDLIVTGDNANFEAPIRAQAGLSLGAVTAAPEAGVIILPTTGGTSSTYVANAPSGALKFFEYNGNLYIKNSSGNVYRVNVTAV